MEKKKKKKKKKKVVYLIPVNHSRSKLQTVTDLIAQHSCRIRYLTLRCSDWREVDISPFAQTNWPIVRQVYVVGFGLVGRTHHMTFSGWDIHIFLDWVRYKLTVPSSRVIICGGPICAPTNQLLHFICQSNEHIAPSDMDCFHTNHNNNPANLEILQVSCLLTGLVEPTILMLSSYSFPSLTILSIQARFLGLHHGITYTNWTHLAVKCPSVQKLTLPWDDDGIMLLLSDNSMWPGLTHLTFIHGPRTLASLSKIVIGRCSAGIPLQRVELYNWEWVWDCDEVSSLKKLVDVAFVNSMIEVQ
jgi:hypothetical protein